jgi:hypothetical protein
MLVEESALIVPLATHFQSGLNEYNSTTEYNINCSNFTQQQFGLKDHRISALKKALDI